MTGDAEQQYFVDGVVEEITTAISRLPCLFVIARNSRFTCKGRAVGLKRSPVNWVSAMSSKARPQSSKWGSHYGPAKRYDDRLTHLAERFDGTLDDPCELQDEFATHVVGAIEPRAS